MVKLFKIIQLQFPLICERSLFCSLMWKKKWWKTKSLCVEKVKHTHTHTSEVSVAFTVVFLLLTTSPLLLHFPWKHLAPILSPLTEPSAMAVSSLGPGPLGTSPDCCPPGTYFLCPIPPSSHPKVPPPAGTGATLRTSAAATGARLCTHLYCW